MRKRSRVTVLCALLLLPATELTWAAEISFGKCPAGVNATARTLMFTSTSQGLRSSRGLYTARRTAAFYYLIPPTPFKDGALIVKVSHHGVPRRPVSDEDQSIAATRPSYNTHCSGYWTSDEIRGRKADGYYQAYEQSIEKQRYVNFHLYKDKDKSNDITTKLDKFHAEVGERNVRGFLFFPDHTSCITTGDDEIRGQFLFDDFRRIASLKALAARASRGLVPEVAEAKAKEYKGYFGVYGQAVAVFPYNKSISTKACVQVNLKIPIDRFRLESTDISIIDADDALFNSGVTIQMSPTSEVVPPNGSQSSWTLRWEPQG